MISIVLKKARSYKKPPQIGYEFDTFMCFFVRKVLILQAKTLALRITVSKAMMY